MAMKYLDNTGLAYFWGKIKSYVANLLSSKADDSAVVHLAGAETVTGAKTFTSTVATNGSYTKKAVNIDKTATGTGEQEAMVFHTTDKNGSTMCSLNAERNLANGFQELRFRNVNNNNLWSDFRLRATDDNKYFLMMSAKSGMSFGLGPTDNGSGIPTTAWVRAATGNFACNAATATKFASAQSVALTGDVTGSASSQAGWSIAATLANSGVTAGRYTSVNVDAKGRVTAGNVKHSYTTAANAAKNWYRIANASTQQLDTSKPIHAQFILTSYNTSYAADYYETWFVNAIVFGRTAHISIFGGTTAPFSQARILYENTVANIDANDRPALDIYLNNVLPNGTTKIEVEEIYNSGWTFLADGQLAVSSVPSGFESQSCSVRGNGVERSTYADYVSYLNRQVSSITAAFTLADTWLYRSRTLNCTGTFTITVPSINSGYMWCVIKNKNATSGVITLHPSTTSVLIDNSNADITLQPGEYVCIHSAGANNYSLIADGRWKTQKADDNAVVHKTGDESISGTKTFNANGSTKIILRDIDTEKGTFPQEIKYNSISFCDNSTTEYSDTSDSNGRFGLIETQVLPSGMTQVILSAYKNALNTKDHSSLGVGYDTQNDQGYAIAPATSEDRDYGLDIVTRNWIPKDDRIVHTSGDETIAGSKTFSNNIIVGYYSTRMAADNSAANFMGGSGSGSEKGAKLTLFGGTASTDTGCFKLHAGKSNPNAWCTLIGKPDGTLTWNGQAVQTSSDERLKTPLAAVPDAVLDAWGDVDWGQFRYLDAVSAKGEKARLHMGLVAQRAKRAFEARGMDACAYGILCHEVREETEDEPAADLWTVRYAEALAMEAAFQRRRADRLEARIAALEEKLNG